MEKPPLTKRQIANLSVGLLGIQFGWGLQNANMSAIYEKLGAAPSLIPLLWLAGPVSALLAHPIIGFMSDRTWSRLGRRRPFLLGGATWFVRRWLLSAADSPRHGVRDARTT